jgi:hypothetical protein
MQWWHFSYHPQLLPTNNEAERALKICREEHSVLAMVLVQLKGSLAFSSLLSVIETCRLRKVDPWTYIAQGRKGIYPTPIPAAF